VLEPAGGVDSFAQGDSPGPRVLSFETAVKAYKVIEINVIFSIQYYYYA